jgi:glycosyltransferase involved in cell wall biosynthesis
MKISIVTISYNQSTFLEEAISSVLDQKDVDFEYIVVDPGSKDNSREIINRYKEKIGKIIFEKDDGPADGLNKGFSYATGEIYGYLNADDILFPGALRDVVDSFRQMPDADVISGHGYIIDKNSKKLYRVFSNKLSSSRFVKKRYTIGYSSVVQQSTFFRKEIFEKSGGFDKAYKIMWDGALTVDFMNHGASFKTVNKIWSGFRIYSESITGSGQHNDTRALDTYRAMQKRAGLTSVPLWEYPVLKYIGWLLEPSLLCKRIADGIRNPKRLNIKVPLPSSARLTR